MKFEVDIEVQTSLQAYMDFKSPLSQSRTSLEAYIDFKFHVSQSRTSIQAYVDLNSSHAVFMAGDGNYIWGRRRGCAADTSDVPPKIWCSSKKGL